MYSQVGIRISIIIKFMVMSLEWPFKYSLTYRPFAHFRLDFKIIHVSRFFSALIPFNKNESVLFMQHSTKITYILFTLCLYNYEFWLSLCKIVRSSVILLLPLLNAVATCEFVICYNITLRNFIISTNFKKLYSLLFVLNVALLWNGNHFVGNKGNNSFSTYNFRIKSGMCK
jgi:hypothetical protein